MILLKNFVQYLLGLPSNPISDYLIKRLIIHNGRIDSLESRSGWRVKIGPCNDRDLLCLRSSVAIGKYESSLIELLSRILANGDVFIDVGANEGYISLPLSIKAGEKGCVFSVEPHPSNVTVLQENIRMNNLSNITVIPSAASDCKGEMQFSGDRAWGTLLGHQMNCKVINVNVDLLDNMIPDNFKSSVNLIKIDAEGNEIKVIRGAKNLILAARPIIVFEVNLSLLAYVDISISETFTFFEKNKYELFKEKEGKLLPFDWLDERICNLFAIPDELLAMERIQSVISR